MYCIQVYEIQVYEIQVYEIQVYEIQVNEMMMLSANRADLLGWVRPALRTKALVCSTSFFCAFLLLLGLQAVPLQAEDEVLSSTATISPHEVVRGQKGWGLSVFAGSEPERFEVEVLGVVQQSTPELSYILARISGHDLERSGVAAGMSGSPVYFDGKLAGAVAYSYPFDLDAVAGITPIGAMRDLSKLSFGAPLEGAMPAAALLPPSVEFEDLVKREFSADLLTRELERLSTSSGGSRSAGAGSSGVLWAASGFGDRARALLDEAVGGFVPMAGGLTGGQGGEVTGDLKAGSAVAALLVDGDLLMAAHGTVTETRGDEVLAFGHPLFSLGPVDLPMAHSEVVTVMANAASSFKISNAGQVVGAFDQDRQAGVRGRLGAEASMTPLSIELAGLSEREYKMRVAELPSLRPLLFAVSTLGALDAGSFSSGPQGIDLEARFRLRDHGDLELTQSFDGTSAGLDSVVFLLGFAVFLDSNSFEKVHIEDVEIRLEQVARPRLATLVAAHAERQRVQPGSLLPVTLELVAWRGERFRRTVEVQIPDDAPEGRYYVLLGDGTSLDAARLTIERRTPETFEQALRQMRSLHSRRQLQVFGLVARPGLSVAGEALPHLPGSVRSILSSGGVSPGAVPLGLAIHHVQLEEMEQPIAGAVRIDVEVEPHRN